MYKMLFGKLKLVSTISIVANKITFKKSKMLFTKKNPFVLKIVKLLYFPLPLFFTSAIADFMEEVD